MRHDRDFWRRHVERWRASGLSQREYAQRHGIVKGTLGWWSSKLNREESGRSDLVEVGHAHVKPSPRAAEDGSPRPIEVLVEGRYLMRLWPGTDRDHIGEVLSVLEQRS